MKSAIKSGLLALAAAALPTVASAHPAIGEAAGFSHGFAHPMSGLDHVLAMVMVGVFAFQLGGRATARADDLRSGDGTRWCSRRCRHQRSLR